MGNRRLKLTPAESKVWLAVQARIGFYRHWPRWREYSGGFLFEEAPGSLLGEVFRRYDGKWTVTNDGNQQVFDELTEIPFLSVEYSHYRHQSSESETRYRAALDRVPSAERRELLILAEEEKGLSF